MFFRSRFIITYSRPLFLILAPRHIFAPYRLPLLLSTPAHSSHLQATAVDPVSPALDGGYAHQSSHGQGHRELRPQGHVPQLVAPVAPPPVICNPYAGWRLQEAIAICTLPKPSSRRTSGSTFQQGRAAVPFPGSKYPFA
ncbi:hypothetical protein DFH27DRAFT_606859 [Peziza echinospora]|nr:hypothetical protein DFH27DRAFT_606859 [Peziza echinospora]